MSQYTQYPTVLSISESGEIAIITAGNGRVIAELLVYGPLKQAAQNASNNTPPERGRVNIFRGDMNQLEKDEFLDIEAELITKIVK